MFIILFLLTMVCFNIFHNKKLKYRHNHWPYECKRVADMSKRKHEYHSFYNPEHTIDHSTGSVFALKTKQNKIVEVLVVLSLPQPIWCWYLDLKETASPPLSFDHIKLNHKPTFNASTGGHIISIIWTQSITLKVSDMFI